MNRYIDADALLRDIDELKESPWYKGTVGHWARVDAVAIIEDLCIRRATTADVAPVRHGAIKHIVYHNGCTPDEDLVCSVCEESVLPDYNYCPNCGATMDLGGGDDDGTI